MKYSKVIAVITAGAMSIGLSGCVSSGLVEDDSYTRTKVGAGVGALAGGLIAYKTSKNKKSSSSKRNKNVVLGLLGGAAVGGGAGYALDVQANRVANVLGTGVDNDPLAELDPDKHLIVSKSDDYVKIMFRDAEMFASGSSRLSGYTKADIAKIGRLLQEYPKTIVVVGGHTDNTGSAALNQKLSQARAVSFADALDESGIQNELSLLGCSFNAPLVSNDTKANRALNRRVEVFLYNEADKITTPCK